MQKSSIHRFLTIIAVLLLMAPFYDSCNGKRMKQVAIEEEVAIDSVQVAEPVVIQNDSIQIKKDSVIQPVEEYKESVFEKCFNYIDDKDSENAVEFAYIEITSFEDFSFNEFIEELKNESKYNIFNALCFHIKNFCFIFIVILTILISILSFFNKLILVLKMAKSNLILLSITLICIFIEKDFESISQIKWGYYVFILVQILIFVTAKKLIFLKKNKT